MYGTTNYRPTGIAPVFAGALGSLLVGSFLLTILAGPVHQPGFAPSPAAQVSA